MIKAAGIIPARYDSQRFPGKLLAPVLGKSVIQLVYEGARKAEFLDRLIIATDDERIFEAAREFGAEVCMTSPAHESGTDRVAEVAEKMESPLVINIQGDEPLLRGEMIDALVEALQDKDTPMASLMARIQDISLISDSNRVKVIVDKKGDALYFSRAPLPFQASDFFFQHIGIYGYQRDFLLRFSRMSPSRLEKTERLEQLRALENGYRIRMVETAFQTLSVDTPRDIMRVKNHLLMKGVHD